MAYTLEAFIARPEAAGVLGLSLGVRPVALEQGFELVPLRRAGNEDASAPSSFGFALWRLTADGEDAAASAAAKGPVVYAEAEYFGGMGEQHAVLWQGGSPRLLVSELPGAINSALEVLGVRRTPSWNSGSLQDEFDSVGLGRLRSTEEWAAT